jgi:hypothetical protein
MFDVKKANAEVMARFDAQFPVQRPGPTGPKTEAGKQRSRLNAYKHGLTGQIQIFTPEEREAFDQHCQSYVEALAPMGILERGLAQSIAEDHWRLNRARALESGIFNAGQQGMLPSDESIAQARTWLAKTDNFQLLAL